MSLQSDTTAWAIFYISWKQRLLQCVASIEFHVTAFRCRWWRRGWRWERLASTVGLQTAPSRSCRGRASLPSTRATSPTCWASSLMQALTWLCMRQVRGAGAHTCSHGSESPYSSPWACSLVTLPPPVADAEVFMAKQEQGLGWPRGRGARWLWRLVQHMWTAGKLPAGTGPHPDAGAWWVAQWAYNGWFTAEKGGAQFSTGWPQ